MAGSVQDDVENGSETFDRVPLGHDVIHGYLRKLDSSPGVYRMLNAKPELL